MDKKLQEDIENIVESIFASKKEVEQKDLMSKTLEKSAKAIEDLTNSLESKKEEMATMKDTHEEELASAKTDLDSVKASLEAKEEELKESANKVETLEAETKDLKEKLEESDKALASMKLDIVVAKRLEELEEAKVLRANKESQEAKIKDMTDEAFASYKEELIELRASVVKELENSADSESDAKEKASAEEDEESSKVPPAEVPSNSISAALDMETVVSDRVRKEYAELGKAMAEDFKNQKN